MGQPQPEQKQQFPTMLGPKPKPFNCAVCHKEHTYGSWEDTEVFFDAKTSYHLGCLQSHYKELISKTKMALENTISFTLLVEKTITTIPDADAMRHILRIGMPIISDIITNLKGALHE